MQILKAVNKVPGGLMLIPLLIGAVINTVAPDAGKYFGSFTNGLLHGVLPVLSVWFFCMGASIDIKATGTVLRKSGTIVVTKIAVAWVVGYLCVHYFLPNGMIETGFFAGISTLAIVTAMDMTNGGLYASIMSQYGTKEEAGAFVLTSIESGPLVTMMILGSTGAAAFEPRLFIGAVLPFIIGFILGNLDKELKAFFTQGCMLMIPFFGLSLGATINLTIVAKTGLLGILLGISVIVITGIPLMFADKYIGGGHGGAGLAASSTAGAAAANPMIIASMVPAFAPMAPAATALVGTSVIVTSIIVPIITALWCKKFGNAHKAKV